MLVPSSGDVATKGNGAATGAIHAMTNGISGYRRRTALSVSSPVHSRDPVGRLDQVVEILHQINRELPHSALGREELIALGGLLTQVGDALLTFTDLLGAPTQRYVRTRSPGADAAQRPAAAGPLQDCRDGLSTARNSARAFHADLKRHLCTRAPGPE